MTRKEQAEITKQHISTAALHLAEKKPLSEIKISDICKEANVSTGSFYHYFKFKEDVFLHIDVSFDSWLKSRAEKRKHLSPRQQLNSIIEDYISNSYTSTWQGLRTYYSLMLSHEDAPVKKAYFIKQIEACLKQGVDNGDFCLRYSIDDSVFILILLLRGLSFDWAYTKGDYDIVNTGKRLVNMIVDQIILPGPDESES